MRLLFLSICFLLSGELLTQNKILDSLNHQLQIAKEDTNKVKILYQLSEECDVKDILKFAVPSLELSEKIGYEKGVADALNNIGFFYRENGESDKALINYLKALKIHQEINNKKGIASVSNNLGIIYYSFGQIGKATEFYITSIKLKEELGDKAGIARSLNGLGNMCNNQGQFEEALKYYIRAMKIQEEIQDEYGLITTYSNIGDLQNTLNKPENAINYYNKALALCEKLNETSLSTTALTGLGGAYANLNQFNKAMDYHLRVKKISEETNNKRSLVYSLNNIGAVFLNQEKYKNAEPYFKQAFVLGEKIGEVKAQRNSLLGLSYLYGKTGKFELAYQTHVDGKLLEDSLNNQQVQKDVIKSQMNYEFQKKEAAIQAEQDKKEAIASERAKIKDFQIYSLLLLLIVAFVIAWLVIRQNKLKGKQKAMQLEQKLLRSQMNPHFIFNSLNSIHSVVLSGDSKMAAKFLASFSKLIRAILESSRFEEITLEKEISLLNNYISLQLLRFEENINYKIEVDPAIDTSTTLLPPMLTQPFIENALEHGLNNIENALLRISFKTNNDYLIIEVSDNGIGLGHSQNDKEHISMATTITKERLILINRKRKKKTKFSITEAYPTQYENKGVKVTFEIPIDN